MADLAKNTRELKSILYGNSESEPVPEACAQLTQEFFRENTLRLLIICLPKLNLEVSTHRIIVESYVDCYLELAIRFMR